jgi:hypothetical protein
MKGVTDKIVQTKKLEAFSFLNEETPAFAGAFS